MHERHDMTTQPLSLALDVAVEGLRMAVHHVGQPLGRSWALSGPLEAGPGGSGAFLREGRVGEVGEFFGVELGVQGGVLS